MMSRGRGSEIVVGRPLADGFRKSDRGSPRQPSSRARSSRCRRRGRHRRHINYRVGSVAWVEGEVAASDAREGSQVRLHAVGITDGHDLLVWKLRPHAGRGGGRRHLPGRLQDNVARRAGVVPNDRLELASPLEGLRVAVTADPWVRRRARRRSDDDQEHGGEAAERMHGSGSVADRRSSGSCRRT